MPNDEAQVLKSLSGTPQTRPIAQTEESIANGFHVQAGDVEADAVADDINPRSPKRRRLISPPESNDDVFGIGAAAARALALSLGQDLSDATTPVKDQNGTHLPQPTSAAIPNSLNNSRSMRLKDLVEFNSLAAQVLQFLAKLNHFEIGEMLFGPPAQRGQDYRALKQKFDEMKKPYVTSNTPFLSIYALDLQESDEIEMVRRINLAIFMASIFSGEIGLRIMDINFLDVFVPEGGRLLKAQGSIYLELKTHAFMAATRTASTMLGQVMTDLFPPDMDKHLLQKRPGAKGLAPSEQDFLNRLGSRRDILYSVIRSNKLNTLPETYRWNDFAREVSLYLTKHMEVGAATSKEGLDQLAHPPGSAAMQKDQMENTFSIHSASPANANNTTQLQPQAADSGTGFDFSFDIEAMVAQAARAAALSMGSGIDMSLLPPKSILNPNQASGIASSELLSDQLPELAGNLLPDISGAEVDSSTHFQHYQPGSSTTVAATGVPDSGQGEIPHKSQTAPTQVLYERARQITTNKSPAAKKTAPPIHRRPWTTEEENALMTGLDEVKGPHWSQILAMYGPGGTINESLKDRNQVQLKDKARNLKLFFLKAGIEVPYYLQAVTGDLRTRAPGQAEKMEREKMQGEEDRGSLDDPSVNAELSDGTDVEAVSSAGSSPDSYPVAEEQTDMNFGGAVEFDMEAIIAQAAASASRGFGPPL